MLFSIEFIYAFFVYLNLLEQSIDFLHLKKEISCGVENSSNETLSKTYFFTD